MSISRKEKKIRELSHSHFFDPKTSQYRTRTPVEWDAARKRSKEICAEIAIPESALHGIVVAMERKLI